MHQFDVSLDYGHDEGVSPRVAQVDEVLQEVPVEEEAVVGRPPGGVREAAALLVGAEPRTLVGRSVVFCRTPFLAHLALEGVGDVAGEGEVERVGVVVHLDELVEDSPLEPQEGLARQAGAGSWKRLCVDYVKLKVAAPSSLASANSRG